MALQCSLQLQTELDSVSVDPAAFDDMPLSDAEDGPPIKGNDATTPGAQKQTPNLLSQYLHQLLQTPQVTKTFSSLGKHYYGESQDLKIDEKSLAPWPVRGVSLAPPRFSNRHSRLSTNFATQ